MPGMSQALRVVAEPCRGIDVCDRKRALVAINHKSPAVVLDTNKLFFVGS